MEETSTDAVWGWIKNYVLEDCYTSTLLVKQNFPPGIDIDLALKEIEKYENIILFDLDEDQYFLRTDHHFPSEEEEEPCDHEDVNCWGWDEVRCMDCGIKGYIDWELTGI